MPISYSCSILRAARAACKSLSLVDRLANLRRSLVDEALARTYSEFMEMLVAAGGEELDSR